MSFASEPETFRLSKPEYERHTVPVYGMTSVTGTSGGMDKGMLERKCILPAPENKLHATREHRKRL